MKEIEKEIRNMSLEEAWKWIEIEENIPEEIYFLIRYGINITFDINYWLNKWIHIKEKTGEIRIGNKWFLLEVVFTEIEERKALAKRYLLEEYAGKTFIKSISKLKDEAKMKNKTQLKKEEINNGKR